MLDMFLNVAWIVVLASVVFALFAVAGMYSHVESEPKNLKAENKPEDVFDTPLDPDNPYAPPSDLQ